MTQNKVMTQRTDECPWCSDDYDFDCQSRCGIRIDSENSCIKELEHSFMHDSVYLVTSFLK